MWSWRSLKAVDRIKTAQTLIDAGADFPEQQSDRPDPIDEQLLWLRSFPDFAEGTPN